MSPRFAGLQPASVGSSSAARGASKKNNTRCEIALRRALWTLGLRYRISAQDLPGRPDVVFRSARVAVFCDGDFWHGRDLDKRLAKLAGGHNAPYWVAKIRSNVERDRRVTDALERLGWIVLRFWETDIHGNVSEIANRVSANVRQRTSQLGS